MALASEVLCVVHLDLQAGIKGKQLVLERKGQQGGAERRARWWADDVDDVGRKKSEAWARKIELPKTSGWADSGLTRCVLAHTLQVTFKFFLFALSSFPLSLSTLFLFSPPFLTLTVHGNLLDSMSCLELRPRTPWTLLAFFFLELDSPLRRGGCAGNLWA